jgi:Kef-type K+ transport system membrane component KefB
MVPQSLLSNIGLVFVVATLFAFIAKILKQPLILAYLVAAAVIGPEIGFAWVDNKETIGVISEIGLILLLFIIGLEIDLKKLLGAGRAIAITGVSQFILCAAMGIGLAFLMGFAPGRDNFDWLYLAAPMERIGRGHQGTELLPAVQGACPGALRHRSLSGSYDSLIVHIRKVSLWKNGNRRS